MYPNVSISKLYEDATNPRKPDAQRMLLLELSLSKLGFLMPVFATKEGMVLSGHQRLTAARRLGCQAIPTQMVDIPEKDIKGINILFNRVTNDFGALTTGSKAYQEVDFEDIVEGARALPDVLTLNSKRNQQVTRFFANACKSEDIAPLAKGLENFYDKKAIVVAENFIRKDIRIPLVVSETGEVVNGIHRMLAALENGITEWPVVRIPEEIAVYAKIFLNYLSMDYHVDETFANVLRYSAYRRPQNNRGKVPKAYRFWGNGCRTLPDAVSYSTEYWAKFRDLHGRNIIDFGSGLCKVAPVLNAKGMNCLDFEPYRIDPDAEAKRPSPEYSRKKAAEFLQAIADKNFIVDSIFLASVMNSIPFPRDRMCVLAIVHALSAPHTSIYGTCRDISDFSYEYRFRAWRPSGRCAVQP
jgi:hypothetical protein